MDLVDKIVALHSAFDRAEVPHAFGGVLALAFCTLDPRTTSDMDCNVFVPSTAPEHAIQALPTAVETTPATVHAIGRDGQVRLWWEGTPVDLFFAYAPVHEAAARRRRVVTFAGVGLPVLACTDIVLLKAFYDRTTDWADIEAVVAAGTLDVDEVRAELISLLGAGDHRVARLDRVVRHSGPPPSP